MTELDFKSRIVEPLFELPRIEESLRILPLAKRLNLGKHDEE